MRQCWHVGIRNKKNKKIAHTKSIRNNPTSFRRTNTCFSSCGQNVRRTFPNLNVNEIPSFLCTERVGEMQEFGILCLRDHCYYTLHCAFDAFVHQPRRLSSSSSARLHWKSFRILCGAGQKPQNNRHLFVYINTHFPIACAVYRQYSATAAVRWLLVQWSRNTVDIS